jgi:hypothetical protein
MIYGRCVRNPGEMHSGPTARSSLTLREFRNCCRYSPRGLIVPNIKGAGGSALRGTPPRSSSSRLPRATARQKVRRPGGGTITVTNISVFGGHGARRSSTPGGRDTGDGHDQAETVGGGWRSAAALRHDSARVFSHRIVDGGMSRAASSRTSRASSKSRPCFSTGLQCGCAGGVRCAGFAGGCGIDWPASPLPRPPRRTQISGRALSSGR